MLLWTKILNTLEMMSYSRAASQLATLGHYDLARNLIIEGSKAQTRRTKAIQRLERIKRAKKSYEPSDNYMKNTGKAFWRGKAHV